MREEKRGEGEKEQWAGRREEKKGRKRGAEKRREKREKKSHRFFNHAMSSYYHYGHEAPGQT